MTDTYTATWRDLYAHLERTAEPMTVRGRMLPDMPEADWVATTGGLNRYNPDGENTATWYPEGSDVLVTPVPIPKRPKPVTVWRVQIFWQDSEGVEHPHGHVDFPEEEAARAHYRSNAGIAPSTCLRVELQTRVVNPWTVVKAGRYLTEEPTDA